MKRRVIVAATLSAIGVWLSVSHAQPDFEVPVPPPPFGPHKGRMIIGFGGEGPGPMLPLVLHHADLTPEQHQKVRELLRTDWRNLQQLFTRLEKANDELSEKLFSPGDVTLANLNPQVEQITEIRRQLMEQGVKTTLAIRSVLTPEQLTKVAEVKERFEKLRAEMQQLMGDER